MHYHFYNIDIYPFFSRSDKWCSLHLQRLYFKDFQCVPSYLILVAFFFGSPEIKALGDVICIARREIAVPFIPIAKLRP